MFQEKNVVDNDIREPEFRNVKFYLTVQEGVYLTDKSPWKNTMYVNLTPPPQWVPYTH